MFVQLFDEVAVNAPTNVVHSDGAGLNVKSSYFGRCVYQNISNFGVMRGHCTRKSDFKIIDDRAVSAEMETSV